MKYLEFFLADKIVHILKDLYPYSGLVIPSSQSPIRRPPKTTCWMPKYLPQKRRFGSILYIIKPYDNAAKLSETSPLEHMMTMEAYSELNTVKQFRRTSIEKKSAVPRSTLLR